VGGSLTGQTYRWADLRFTNGTDEKNITDAGDAGWIDYSLYYWDTTDRVFLDAPTTLILYPWDAGYFMWSNQNNIQLIRRN
jgi:hypothetical protein